MFGVQHGMHTEITVLSNANREILIAHAVFVWAKVTL